MIEVDCRKCVNLSQNGCSLYGNDADVAVARCAENCFSNYCVEQPKGKWITRHKQNSFGQDIVCFECNKCGEYKVPLYHLLITEPLKVCPNCGADMQKGGAE